MALLSGAEGGCEYYTDWIRRKDDKLIEALEQISIQEHHHLGAWFHLHCPPFYIIISVSRQSACICALTVEWWLTATCYVYAQWMLCLCFTNSFYLTKWCCLSIGGCWVTIAHRHCQSKLLTFITCNHFSSTVASFDQYVQNSARYQITNIQQRDQRKAQCRPELHRGEIDRSDVGGVILALLLFFKHLIARTHWLSTHFATGKWIDRRVTLVLLRAWSLPLPCQPKSPV